MSIEPVSTFPFAAQAAAQRKMQDLLSWDILKFGSQPAENSSLILSFPHRVFWISIRDLRDRRTLAEAADHRAWRFLVLRGENVVAAVQTWNDLGTWRVSSIHTGGTATRTAAALDAADAKVNTPCEPCYIWCRAAWTAAMWLRPSNGTPGAVVKLPGITTQPTTSSETDFIAALRTTAGF
jgi:hypothetical protein